MWELKLGALIGDSYSYDLRGVPITTEDRHVLEGQYQKSPYMCTWAYELLRRDRAAATLDLRTFHDRQVSSL